MGADGEEVSACCIARYCANARALEVVCEKLVFRSAESRLLNGHKVVQVVLDIELLPPWKITTTAAKYSTMG